VKWNIGIPFGLEFFHLSLLGGLNQAALISGRGSLAYLPCKRFPVGGRAETLENVNLIRVRTNKNARLAALHAAQNLSRCFSGEVRNRDAIGVRMPPGWIQETPTLLSSSSSRDVTRIRGRRGSRSQGNQSNSILIWLRPARFAQ